MKTIKTLLIITTIIFSADAFADFRCEDSETGVSAALLGNNDGDEKVFTLIDTRPPGDNLLFKLQRDLHRFIFESHRLRVSIPSSECVSVKTCHLENATLLLMDNGNGFPWEVPIPVDSFSLSLTQKRIPGCGFCFPDSFTWDLNSTVVEATTVDGVVIDATLNTSFSSEECEVL